MAPEPEFDPHEVEAALTAAFGPHWVPYNSGDTVKGLKLVAAQFRESPSGRLVLSGLTLLGDGITADQLRSVPIVALENSANLTRKDVDREKLDALPPLKRDRDVDPDEFSRLVAQHYRLWSSRVPHPASAMAAEHDVKLSTMHTWIREARLRGHLPPARRGKVTSPPPDEEGAR